MSEMFSYIVNVSYRSILDSITENRVQDGFLKA